MKKIVLSVVSTMFVLAAFASPAHAAPSTCFAVINSTSGQYQVRDDFQHVVNTIIAPQLHTTPGQILSALAHGHAFSNAYGTVQFVCP